METVLNVEGMTCSHCENAVKKAVSAIDGVASVTVDLVKKKVVISHDDRTPIDLIKNEIEEQGYDVT